MVITEKPRGWWYAQGYRCHLIDGHNEEGPYELPDGRVVCGPHGIYSVCEKCDSDYTNYNLLIDLINKAMDFNPYNDSMFSIDLTATTKREIGNVFPRVHTPRIICRNDPRSILISTDGACLNNDQSFPKAGWGFAYGPITTDIIYGPLENRKLFGGEEPQTSNRAELTAVILALRFRHWIGEGLDKITIVTDSEYVVKGSTRWARTWVVNNWKTRTGQYVKNRDLWEALLNEVERWKSLGLSIQFWKIPRDWNKIADEAAKKGAAHGRMPDPFGFCIRAPTHD
ncbi:putative ribonuclease H1 [Annulohypoxylon nitens]|nr:putative ribonuclease H1 [Annulohypoxylon nitens]